jgi:SAM-dependent methyltransferase
LVDVTAEPMAPEAGAASISAVEAMDAAFTGSRCHVVLPDGSSRLMAASRWAGQPSTSDVALFVDPCVGPTLDLGCGPGRLSGALASRGVDVMGVDISPEAVRQTRRRGVPAVCQDVFDHLPRPGTWSHVLLADGNIGLGGHPVRLLGRVAELMSPAGTALVELDGPGGVSVHHDLQLRVEGRTSRPFSWATVGVGAICTVAAAAGLVASEVRSVAGRQVATLRHGAARPGRR